ncbi:MAG: hypothetical protein KDA21_13770, partial [Phycisphaerales bacterium]|nr:hypothetical protein [Phycisphaerales bacterium]
GVTQRDLIVTAVSGPSVVAPGSLATVTWTVRNIGGSDAVGPWIDRIWASDDAMVGDDVALVDVLFDGTLGPGETIVRSQAVVMPTEVGTIRLVACADNGDGIDEFDEGNNCRVANSITRVGAPDFMIAALNATPEMALTGDDLIIQWTVSNGGTAANPNNGRDAIYLSDDATLEPGEDLLLEEVLQSVIAPGETYDRTRTHVLPATAGDYWVFVVSDVADVVEELTGEDNNTASFGPITVASGQQPDLVVTALTTPSQLQAGEVATIEYTVENQGTTPAVTPWSDAIYLASSADARGGAPILLQLAPANAQPLEAGQAYTRSRTVTIPTSYDGDTGWILVVTDNGDAVDELLEGNNRRISGALPVLPPIAPDLVADVVTPGAASFGQTIALEWSVSNIGVAPAAGGWVDAVYLSDNPTLDAGDLRLAARAGDAPLADGSAYNALLNVALPVSIDLPTGNYFFFVVADDNDTLLELSESNNSDRSDSVVLTRPPLPDFVVNSVVAPGAAAVGQAVDITFRVANNGPVDFDGTFTSLVTITPLTRAGPVSVAAVDFTGLIPSGGVSGDIMASFALPDVTTPAFIVAVTADITNAVIEGNESNNRGEAAASDYIRADLAAVSVSGPASGVADALVTFDYSVRNDGQVSASPAWVDTIYLSSDNVVGSDIPIGSRVNNAALGAAASYNASLNARIPGQLLGTYYIIIRTNTNNLLNEGGATANNTFVSPTPITISQPDRPNLVVTSVPVPGDELSGRGMTVTWEVMNIGPGTAPGLWLDRVYASSDDVFSADDILLGEQLRTMALPSGGMYTGMLSTQAPSPPGDYTIIVRTDVANSVNEGVSGGENDNTSAAPAPFHVDTFTATANADVTSAPAATPVTITGVATVNGTSTPADLVPVTVRIRRLGFEHRAVVMTDGAGAYSYVFTPAPTEGGHYTVAAGPAHVTNPAATDTFDLYALVFQPDDGELETPAGIAKSLSLRLNNPGDHAQTGITFNVVEAPAGVTVTPDFARRRGGLTLDPLQTLLFDVEIQGSQVVEQDTPLVFEMTSDQGGRARFTVSLFIGPPDAEIVVVPGDLDMGVFTAEAVREVVSYAELRLTNTGGLPSQPLSVSVPDLPWLTLISPETLSPIANATTAAITLRLAADDSVPLGTIESVIRVAPVGSTTGAEMLEIPVRLSVQSAAAGDVLIEATDQFTYYAEGMPRIAGADVIIADPDTLTPIAVTTTDADGYALVQGLIEGNYNIEVRAAEHGTFRSNVFIRGGMTNEVEAFLPRELITYTWTVVPIEFTDEYEITLELEFATQMPAPVVVLEPGRIEFDELEYPAIVEFTLTNHGLITADNVTIGVEAPAGMTATPLVEFLGDLPGMTTFNFPVLFTEIDEGAASRASTYTTRGGGGGGNCGAVSACYTLVCGDHTLNFCASSNGGACGGGGFVNPQGGSGGGGVINPQGGGTVNQMGCGFNDCVEKCILTQGGCIPGPVGCGFSLAGCGLSFDDNVTLKDTLKDLLGCAGVGVDCLLDTTVIYDVVTCICKVLRDCNSNCEDFSGLPCSAGDLIPFIGNNIIDLFRMSNDELFQYTGNPEYDFFLDQYYGWSSYVVILNEIYGDPAFLDQGPASAAAFRNFNSLFDDFTTDGSEDGGYLSAGELAQLLAAPRPNPEAVTDELVNHFAERWNRSLDYYALDITSAADLPVGWDPDFIDIGRVQQMYDFGATAEQAADAPDGGRDGSGFSSLIEALEYAAEVLRFERSQVPEGICAPVRIRLDQTATLTRRAFRASLELDNGTLVPMEDLTIELTIRDEFGNDANDLFGLSNPEITGMLDAIEGGTLLGGSTGGADWIILPTNDAAPTGITYYTVSGRIDYTFQGQSITIPLFPVAIQVIPNPNLDLDYFIERVVYSDDPFTPVVEPTVPFSLGMLVANNGAGVANNLTITTSEPQIIENERGLLIDFDIIGAEVNNDARQPSLSLDFGDVLPDDAEVARWLMTSTLQGEFIGYQASFEHVPPFDGAFNDPEFSVINSVDIYGLTHVVRDTGPGADNLFDFLTDDFPDIEDLADRLHRSDDTIAPVTPRATADVASDLGMLTAMVTVPAPSGYVYIRIDDPFDAAYPLASVTRTDGIPIMLGWNAWITERIDRRQTGSPVKRYLHIFDHGGTGSYNVQYNPDNVAPEVLSWTSLRSHGSAGDRGLVLDPESPQTDPRAGGISDLVAAFSEPVDADTIFPAAVSFDGSDAAGDPIDLSGVSAAVEIYPGEIGVRITFTPALPENGRYCVRLVGVTDRAGNLIGGARSRLDISSLPGDASGNLLVNNADVGGIASLAGPDPISGEVLAIRSDLNADGFINDDDILIALGNRRVDLRFVPPPCFARGESDVVHIQPGFFNPDRAPAGADGVSAGTGQPTLTNLEGRTT